MSFSFEKLILTYYMTHSILGNKRCVVHFRFYSKIRVLPPPYQTSNCTFSNTKPASLSTKLWTDKQDFMLNQIKASKAPFRWLCLLIYWVKKKIERNPPAEPFSKEEPAQPHSTGIDQQSTQTERQTAKISSPLVLWHLRPPDLNRSGCTCISDLLPSHLQLHFSQRNSIQIYHERKCSGQKYCYCWALRY